MAKIISMNDTTVQIGTDDGKIKEVRREDVKFDASIGDKVDVFESESSIIVTKAEEPVKTEAAQPNNGINININNENSNNSNNTGYTGTYVGDGKKVVNKWVYVLLAFFLGGIGAHKFYAGKTGAGVCYLLFCWTGIPAFIALIECIVGLCAQADSNGNILV